MIARFCLILLIFTHFVLLSWGSPIFVKIDYPLWLQQVLEHEKSKTRKQNFGQFPPLWIYNISKNNLILLCSQQMQLFMRQLRLEVMSDPSKIYFFNISGLKIFKDMIFLAQPFSREKKWNSYLDFGLKSAEFSFEVIC